MSKMNKPRLGRGLNALLSVSDMSDDSISPEAPSGLLPSITAPHDGLRILEVSVDRIHANPSQPRKEFDESSLLELAASLKTNGVIQPIILRQVGNDFELIAGERRLRAAKLAGFLTIPSIVKEVDGLTQAQMALVENIQREDLNAIDRAQAYRMLLEQLGLSHAELATRLGEDRSIISNHLRLLELAMPVRELLRKRQISLGHAKVLAGVADILEQERLGKLTVEQELSVRSLERLVQANPLPIKGKAAPRSAHIKGLEQSISRQLGMKVNVRAKTTGKGKLIIDYSSLDQFDELMGRMGVRIAEEE